MLGVVLGFDAIGIFISIHLGRANLGFHSLVAVVAVAVLFTGAGHRSGEGRGFMREFSPCSGHRILRERTQKEKCAMINQVNYYIVLFF